MILPWMKPTTVTFNDGDWLLGTVRGGPFDDSVARPVTTLFGPNPNYPSGFHGGLDVAAPLGTPLYAMADGIAYGGFDPTGAGNYVVVETYDGWHYEYLHMQSPTLVGWGSWVPQGTLVGYIGSTGWSSGPHLHLNIGRGGNYDPAAWLDTNALDVGADLYPPAAVYLSHIGEVPGVPWQHDFDITIDTIQPNTLVELVSDTLADFGHRRVLRYRIQDGVW